ncbi:hypothetical protein D3870_11970 [Noviherbaspirillum cavernae]|uniref:Uncharacterized protein n=1 Tax=Noviherbaspirillum cavernae TaxID=2320862 RepID=A0A418X2E5_9BURK|nr:hypothetical protein [Noviherbaspirillum cavernae]RJG06632.1 hypothetical protein D3870_11970 [Noviherbaspirillum cavernae]
MATRKECDQYAEELNDRLDALIRWAIANWPKRDFPLLQSDFAQSRREIGGIIGPKLGDGEPDNTATGSTHNAPPYIAMNPMPWP